MVATAVEFLLEKLKQLLIHHAHLFSGADHEAEKQLDNHLRRFKALQKQSRNNDEELKGPIRRIRDAVYKAEDTIDAYVSQKNSSQEPPSIAGIVEEVEVALEIIGRIYGEKASTADFAGAEVEDGGEGVNEENSTKEQNIGVGVVGIEDEMEKLVGYLVEETTELDVISIIGMPGLGKTVLA